MSQPVNISRISVAIPAEPRFLLLSKDATTAPLLLGELQKVGFTGKVAGDTEAAVRSVEEEPPDLVLVEGCNERDALDFCRDLKSSPRSHFIPIIGLYVDRSQDARLAAVRAGFDHVLVQPREAADMEELLARANILVRSAALYRATAAKAESLMMRHDWMRYLVHDLRTPIGVAMGNVTFALADIPAEAEGETRRALDEAQYELSRVVAMFQDLLDTDRLQRGALAPKVAPVDVGRVARQIAAKARVFADEKRTTIEVNVAGVPALEADPTLIDRVLANLITNAVRYARHKAVVVAVDGRADEVVVRVANDGPGIESDVAQKLFEPWAKLDTKHAVTAGTGLGLAFCRLVVEAHGGRIWIDSLAEGNVVFAFRLPRTRSN